MANGSMNGSRISNNENKEFIGREELARDQVRQEAAALVKRVAEGYSTLRSLMEQNPWLTQEMDAEDRERKRAFDEKLQQGLRRANDAPRCRWVRQDGTSCGSPQMRNHIYCYAHRQMMEARALALRLPAAEDANSIQVGLMRIQKALIDDTISTKKAGLLLYSMQLAMTNVGQTTFGNAADDDLVTDTVEEQGALQEEASVEIPGPIFTRDIRSRFTSGAYRRCEWDRWRNVIWVKCTPKWDDWDEPVGGSALRCAGIGSEDAQRSLTIRDRFKRSGRRRGYGTEVCGRPKE